MELVNSGVVDLVFNKLGQDTKITIRSQDYYPRVMIEWEAATVRRLYASGNSLIEAFLNIEDVLLKIT